MRILFLTQYYPPETGAPQARLSDLARRLKAWGHTPTVLTALPNYPRGEVFDGYRGRLLMEEEIDGIRVVRSWIYVTKNTGFFPRLLNYFSFMLSSLIPGIGKVGRHDVVVVESPPLFVGLSGVLVSRLRRAKLVFNVSDLWLDSAVVMRVVRNKVLIKLSTWLEDFIYRQSHAITGQTQGIVQSIRSRFPRKRVVLITNGVDAEVFVPASRFVGGRERIRRELGLNRQFVVGYAGLYGLAMGLESVIEAARIVSGHREIVFAFFGDGPEKTKVVDLAHQLGLSNIRFYPTQPRARMPEIIASFDVALVPLKRIGLFKGAIPSKMFEPMGAAVPVIVSVDGEARALVEWAQAGIYVEPENSQAMAEAILRLCSDSEYRERLGQNGRRYAMEHFDRKEIAKKFEQVLMELCGSETGSHAGR